MYCSVFIDYNFTLICFPFSHFRSPLKAGLECRFIISAWISGANMADKSEGRRSSSNEGVDFLPHCFQASSSSLSTMSSRSSVMWNLWFEASTMRTNWGIGEMTKAGPKCHFIISAWIFGADMADKSEGRRSSSGEGVDFLPHCFQASSSSSSTTSSRSSVMWNLRFEASATRTNWGNDESGPGMPLHHLSLDLRRRHGRQIGGTEIELRRGRRFLAPLLLGVVLLVVKIVRDVDPSV
jgi:hypothetical protein